MSYGSTTDFLALLRETGSGARTLRMPGLDYVIAAFTRAGLVTVVVSPTAPTDDQETTLWFKPSASGSWVEEGAVFIYNQATTSYEPANPVLWSSLLLASAIPPQLVQDIVAAGPTDVLVGAGTVRVMNVGAAVAVTMPLASDKVGPVLISDWLNGAGTYPITISLSGSDKFPGNLTTWTIAADAGSVFLRPVGGGYAL